FDVNEGKRVRVKEIEFVGARDGFSQSRLRGAMKLVKEAGLFSNFSSKDIYFKDKLMEDLERVKFFLGTKGYLQAKLGEPQVAEAGKVSSGLPLPLFRKSGPGLKISIPIEVGRRYKITGVKENGVTIFTPGIITAVSGLKVGDYADAKKLSENVYKGIKDLYGTQGYIQAEVSPIPKFIDKTPEEGEVEWTLEVEEGRQFTLRRLEFIGNTNTRDVVMRREVLLNEGDAYNKRYWDLSMLRLNQLGLFDEIKEKDAITRTNDRDQTVDIDLQVKEKGRQQIQLNGGVSGYQGSFFGLEYSTNNLLGYGESLSVAVSGGNRSKSVSFGFTEPYLMGKPISLGFQVFGSQYQYVGGGFDLASQQAQLIGAVYGNGVFDADELFTQKTVGGSVNLSGSLRLFTKRFEKFSRLTRLQMSYSLTGSTVKDPKVNLDDKLDNDTLVAYSQPRIITSRIFPSIYYSSKNATIDATSGKSLFLGFGLSGGILGGDVRTFSPSLEFQYFKPALRRGTDKPHVLAMRFKADHIRAYGAPPPIQKGETQSLSFVGGIPIFERFFLGGDQDIRGYNLRSLGPIVRGDVFLSTRGPITPKVSDADGNLVDYTGPIAPGVTSQFLFDAPVGNCAGVTGPGQKEGCNVALRREPTTGLPYISPAFLGGDTQFVYNIEYRVPIASVLSVAAFADVGTAFNVRKYKDQISTSNFLPGQNLGSVILDPQGNQVTDLTPFTDESGNLKLPEGYNTVSMFGSRQNFQIVRATEANNWSLKKDLRSSLGLEFRVQLPVINVPFRLITAYNPYADVSKYGFVQKKSVIRFSVGRTF
ncbi:MAG TPA: outer membrane protein assembly factor BamA, partial [Blastocatellia bacterium]|nr:outer membrane protein assembly factor BamA [Blastocatellia bacterium]